MEEAGEGGQLVFFIFFLKFVFSGAPCCSVSRACESSSQGFELGVETTLKKKSGTS